MDESEFSPSSHGGDFLRVLEDIIDRCTGFSVGRSALSQPRDACRSTDLQCNRVFHREAFTDPPS